MESVSSIRLDASLDVPLYRQLADVIQSLIEKESLVGGERLPATRDLAGQLGLNRTTVSAAYALLEESGFIRGHVGRGSFVAERLADAPSEKTRRPLKTPGDVKSPWDSLLSAADFSVAGAGTNIQISFASSRPAADAFPLAQFRRLAKQVIDSPDAADILQLGSAYGYAPLRRYLLEQAVSAGIARPGDDLLITNGCQQGLDLIARLFASEEYGVLVEEPVYHGVLRVFSRAGAAPVPVMVDDRGLDLDMLELAIQQGRSRLLVVTPSFQNPTGATLSLARRKRLLEIVQRSGLILVENDIYSELRYEGHHLPTLKALDQTGNTIILRSYSKVSFPGLRVGWIIAPRTVIARLAEAKQTSDLHSDQLSQAVLLRFAESGELERHIERTCAAGVGRLNAAGAACTRWLPKGTKVTRPQGGMSLWVELPSPLSAEHLLTRVQDLGVDFLPGRYFSSGKGHFRSLRISFGGLPPDQITRGIQIIGEAAAKELAAAIPGTMFDPVPALV